VSDSHAIMASAAGLGWLAVVAHFWYAWRQPHGRTDWYPRVLSANLLLAASAITIFLLFNLGAFDSLEWARALPVYLIGTIATLVSVSLYLQLFPHYRPRHNWPLICGLAALGEVALLRSLTAQRLIGTQLSPAAQDAVAVTPYSAFVLIAFMRLGVPAALHGLRQERRTLIRTRYAALLTMHTGLSAWMLVDIAGAALALIDQPFNTMPFILVLGLAVTGAYILFVLPTPVYVAVARNAEVVEALWSAALVHLVEQAIARGTGRAPAPAQWRQPRRWLYRSVIAICDAQQLLAAVPERRMPGWLKRAIAELSMGDKPYDFIVAELRRAGWRLLMARALNPFSHGRQ
jgi:hypothetical protein